MINKIKKLWNKLFPITLCCNCKINKEGAWLDGWCADCYDEYDRKRTQERKKKEREERIEEIAEAIRRAIK